MLERLKRALPLPYHLCFMVELASGVPPSLSNERHVTPDVSRISAI
jgi:hypothetical protein